MSARGSLMNIWRRKPQRSYRGRNNTIHTLWYELRCTRAYFGYFGNMYNMLQYAMQIIEIETSKLKPYDNNAKTHPDEQVQLIANSIKEFGWRTPIIE